MEIILTHNNMDFDSLAAQFAVSKLYPTARILPGYPLVGNVREFLSLYRDTLPIVQLKYIDWKQVNHAFIVDCQHAERLDETARKYLINKERPISYTIFDHHQVDPEGLGPGAREDSIVKMVGSTTTVLVEQLRKRKLKLTPFEATLLLIGIYEDTGCLTYRGTTADDADCVAYLLKHGADLIRANDFLHPKMDDEQVKLLEDLVRNYRCFTLSGTKVIIAMSERPRYMDGLATLTRKLVEIESAHTAFTVVRMRDRVHVVGRSDSPSVDVRSIVREFGGDGHAGAGSAVVRDKTVGTVADEIENMIRSYVQPEITAAEIMTTPVRTIRSRTTMEEAGRMMLRYGLDGLVVVDYDQMVGIVSRRDIDQAMHHKLGHAPVQGFMSKPVMSIPLSTALSEIQRIMVKEDIGRLPVVDGEGNLVGIVSRKEVLNTLYGNADGERDANPFMALDYRGMQMGDKFDSLDEPTQWLVKQIGVSAAQLNMMAYAVGGCVRDLILGLPNFDLDFVVEGSAIKLAEALESTYPGRLEVLARHERFQTATLAFHCGKKLEVDLSTARTEFYAFPAALPTVEASGLQQDLYRRDFTINALAICLNPGRYGELVDFFDGMSDLESKTIRILHPFSFIEDPTRIVRAARFAARLGCKLDTRTREQAQRAIDMGIFDDLGGVRMRTELQLILESPHRLNALDLLGDLGGKLRYLDVHLHYGPQVRWLLRRAERLLEHYPVSEDWVVYLGLLLSQLPLSQVALALERLHLANDHKEHIIRGLQLLQQLPDVNDNLRPSQIFSILHGNSDHSLAIAACLAKPGQPLRRMIKLYLEELKGVSVELSGADLLSMGIPQGPGIGHVLHRVTEAKLDGLVRSLQEEISFVKQHCLPGAP